MCECTAAMLGLEGVDLPYKKATRSGIVASEEKGTRTRVRPVAEFRTAGTHQTKAGGAPAGSSPCHGAWRSTHLHSCLRHSSSVIL